MFRSHRSVNSSFAHPLRAKAKHLLTLNPVGGVGWGGTFAHPRAFAYPKNNPKTFDTLPTPCNFGLDIACDRERKHDAVLLFIPFPTDHTWIKLNI